MKLHELKIKKEYFQEVYFGKKTFELRKDDRDYEVGDLIKFNVIDNVVSPNKVETEVANIDENRLFEITYILRNVPEYGLDKDYCILGIKELDIRNYE